MSAESFREAVYKTVKTIPEGMVISYGDVAAFTGRPRAARQVGQIAKRGLADLPWHRVVKSDGTLAPGFAWGGADEQQRMLEAEGIEFNNGRIKNFATLRWSGAKSKVQRAKSSKKPSPITNYQLPTTSPLIVVVGETASGKSNLAMSLAQRYDGEIVNADSWNVYRGMDIGTAKPSIQERAQIPHHLIDIVPPDGDYTAADFQRDAKKAIAKIQNQGKLPIMVGGNGLYVDSVLFDYSFLPPGSPGQREELSQKSIPDLLSLIDSKGYSLQGIDTRNKRRLIRLIENEGKNPTRSELRPNTLVLGLKISRTQLRARIEERVENMFRRGLRREVDELVQKYGWEHEAMKGIGYWEFKGYYEGELSMTQVKQKIIRNTLQLAKRQRTWFKRNQHIQWVDDETQASGTLNSFLNNQ